MKKILFTLTLFLSLSIYINAQNLQRNMYNDGKLLVYIEQKTYYWNNGGIGPRKVEKYLKSDELKIENISDFEITLKYAFKSVAIDSNSNILSDRITYRDITLSAGNRRTEDGKESRGSGVNSYYVDSFAIMNVQTKNSQQNNRNQPQYGTGTQKSFTVPQWAQGTWDRTEGNLKITSTQLIISKMDIYFPCTKILGNTLHFEGIVYDEDFSTLLFFVVTRTDSPDKLKIEIYADEETTPRLTRYPERWRGY